MMFENLFFYIPVDIFAWKILDALSSCLVTIRYKTLLVQHIMLHVLMFLNEKGSHLHFCQS